jgi:hypothetical protein
MQLKTLKLTEMKSFIFPLTVCFAIIFISCQPPKKKDQNIPKPVPKKQALIIGNPLDCGIENISLFPVGTNYKPQVYEGNRNSSETLLDMAKSTLTFSSNSGAFSDRLAEKEYINGNENEFDIRNILFYDLKGGGTYPLVSDTIHILSFAIHKEFPSPKIFYRVVEKDINKDSIYNSKDPVMLFISDIFGKNLVQVTPDNEQFLDYFYYPDTQKILIKSAIDTDDNKEFTSSDETNFRDMDIKDPKMGREIFSKSLKDSLRFK